MCEHFGTRVGERLEIQNVRGSVKGSGRGGQHQQHRPALGEGGDFAVHASVYGKVQAEPNVKPNDQQREKGRERCLLVAQAGLASYLCRLCTLSVHLSVLGGWITPPPPPIFLRRGPPLPPPRPPLVGVRGWART